MIECCLTYQPEPAYSYMVQRARHVNNVITSNVVHATYALPFTSVHNVEARRLL